MLKMMLSESIGRLILNTTDLAEIEMHFQIKLKILQNGRFHIPFEKHDYESGAWQHESKLPITIARHAKSPHFQSFINENENHSQVCRVPNLLPFGAECSAGLPNLPNLQFSKFGSRSVC